MQKVRKLHVITPGLFFLEYLSRLLYYSYITNHYTADSIVLTLSKFKITLNYFYLFLFMHCLNFLSFMFIFDISNPLILIVIRRRLKVLHECVRIGERSFSLNFFFIAASFPHNFHAINVHEGGGSFKI